MALLFVDLDRFKSINDSLGHPVGDTILVEAAYRLQTLVRASDTIVRLGSDEFVVILEDIHTAERAAEVAAKIVAVLAEPMSVDGRETFVGARVGISVYPIDAQDAPAMLRNADMAMSRAKDQGRGRFHFFTQDLHERVSTRLEMEGDLRKAVHEGGLLLHYQPIVSLTDGRVTGAEALVRWPHPQRGLIAPDAFIPLAEETGLIGPLGRWVMQAALSDLAQWRACGAHTCKITVNVSCRQWQLGFTPDEVAAMLRATGVPARQLGIEITESSMMLDAKQALAWLSAVRGLGVSLSVDDFGTGYSSLSYLKSFPMQTLKIDRSFVNDLPGDAEDLSLVQTILAMADSLHLAVVAEGIETAGQAQLLRDLGCGYGQGYYFSRPVSAARMGDILLAKDSRLPAAGAEVIALRS